MSRTPGQRGTDSSPVDTRLPGPGPGAPESRALHPLPSHRPAPAACLHTSRGRTRRSRTSSRATRRKSPRGVFSFIGSVLAAAWGATLFWTSRRTSMAGPGAAPGEGRREGRGTIHQAGAPSAVRAPRRCDAARRPGSGGGRVCRGVNSWGWVEAGSACRAAPGAGRRATRGHGPPWATGQRRGGVVGGRCTRAGGRR
jgi:hypothetical protein